MATTTTEPLSAGELAEAPGFTLTRVRMCCGKTRYSLVGVLQPGDEVLLEDPDGRVHATDCNASTTARPTRLTRILSSRHDLAASFVPRDSTR